MPTPTVSYPVVEGYDLPRIPSPYEEDWNCTGFGIDPLTLHGELIDGIAVVQAAGPTPFTIFWPRGYKARFEPDLVILNKVGVQVAQEGTDLNLDWHWAYVCPFMLDGSVVVYILPNLTPSP